jgi:hypothetical protein
MTEVGFSFHRHPCLTIKVKIWQIVRSAKLATNKSTASGGRGDRHCHYPRDVWYIQSTSVRRHRSRWRGRRLWARQPQPTWTQRAQIEPAYQRRRLLPSPSPTAVLADVRHPPLSATTTIAASYPPKSKGGPPPRRHLAFARRCFRLQRRAPDASRARPHGAGGRQSK